MAVPMPDHAGYVLRHTSRGVHHACRPSNAQDTLGVLRQNTTHWNQAVLLILHLSHLMCEEQKDREMSISEDQTLLRRTSNLSAAYNTIICARAQGQAGKSERYAKVH
eukprot:1160632-Pelagomonas_calceolata.AAC.8